MREITKSNVNHYEEAGVSAEKQNGIIYEIIKATSFKPKKDSYVATSPRLSLSLKKGSVGSAKSGGGSRKKSHGASGVFAGEHQGNLIVTQPPEQTAVLRYLPDRATMQRLVHRA